MPKTEGELRNLAGQPGWRLETGEGEERLGTLEELAKVAHARRARGEHPGVLRQIENAVELEMLDLEQLWRAIGLPT